MSKVFRARFVAGLRKELGAQPAALYDSLFKHNWVVYCKRPFLGPPMVIEYLGRYIHPVTNSTE